MPETVSGHDLVRTYLCKTPGCAGEARSATGRHAYCDRCRIARGTATATGEPIESKSHAVSRRRKGKQLGPFEERALAVVEAGRSLDLAVARFKLARPTLELAVSAYRSALNEAASIDLSASLNGAGPDVPEES